MIKLLDQPYPIVDDSRKMMYGIASLVFLFVFLFLYVFKPFNIEQALRVELYQGALAFAGFSTLCYIGYVKGMVRFFPRWIKDEQWTIGREFIFVNAFLFFLALGNALIRSYIAPTPEQSIGMNIANDLFYTYTIGFFPIVTIIIFRYILMLKQQPQAYVKEVVAENGSDEKPATVLTIYALAGNNDLEVDSDALIYLKSDGNYVEFYVEEEIRVVRHVRRNTIGNIEQQLVEKEHFFRTHRQYIVNTNKILNVSGNAQGYMLTVDRALEEIPVSRGKIAGFDARFMNKKQLCI